MPVTAIAIRMPRLHRSIIGIVAASIGIVAASLLAGCAREDHVAKVEPVRETGAPRGTYLAQDGKGMSVSITFLADQKIAVVFANDGKTDESEGTFELQNNRVLVTVRGDTLEFARKGNVLESWKNGQILVFAKQ